MAYDIKEGQGSLFKNRKKEKDTHPDWTGEIKINGQVYWLSAWDKHSDKAGTWFSISTKKKDFKPAMDAAKSQKTYSQPLEDDLPPF